jgi:hypothetical protein
MNLDEILEQIRQDNIQVNIDNLVAEIEAEEDMMLLTDPRFFGPDADEGANDCDGLFYWDLK